MTGWIDGIRGVLLDVDGTLLDGDAAIPGAAAALRRLRDRGVRIRITTNTSRRPRSAVAAALRAAGVEVEPQEVLVPAFLARRRILDSGRRRAALLVPPAAAEDFDGVVADTTSPDWLVLGDLGDGFTFERMNEAFRLIRGGARFLVLHRNRYWDAGGGRQVLDVGAYAAALETATGVSAESVGKPEPAFFEIALREIGLPAGDVLVVGDDAESDVAGGASAGCRTARVGTGKGAAPGPAGAPRPDLAFRSIADLLPVSS